MRAPQIAAELGSVVLDTLGLPAAIEWHVHRLRKSNGLLYELNVKDAAGFPLPEEYAATVFEIYHEALSNVARHAAAKRVAIALTITPYALTLVVRDDGIGSSEQRPPDSRPGGLAEIRRRALAYEGSCDVATRLNNGTTLTVSLPLPRPGSRASLI